MKKKSTKKKTLLEEQLEAESQQQTQGLQEEPAEEEHANDKADPEAASADADESVPPEAAVADIEALTVERDELKDQLLRARAEFDNYRKRTARDIERIRKTATERLVRDLLPVIDHLELALKHADQASQAVAEGVQMVAEQFAEVLSRYGVEPIPAVGEVFDPNVHEAMMQRADDNSAPNTVLEEFQRGYRMGDLILRPAKVVVCSGPEEQSPGAPDEGAEEE
ncbi:MAG: nucleotide exchange factor GrpE [Candidatus Hydrogenedentota bacterium]